MKNNDFFSKSKILVSLVLLMAGTGLYAQPNFSGTWAFNESKSNFGESQFRWAATTIVVVHEGNNLTMENTMPGRDGGEVKSTDKLTLDGQVCENPMFNTTRKSIVTFSEDKSSMIISSTMNFERDGESREFKTSASWKLSEEGKVLLIESSYPTPDGGEIKTILAYDKK
jgi:hypothetical protein